MNLFRKFLTTGMIVSVSVITYSNPVSHAAPNCVLTTSPVFYKASYFPVATNQFKIYVEINSCTGISGGSLQINDAFGGQAKFMSSANEKIPDGMPSRGSVLEGFSYLVTGLKSGQYSFSLNGWQENAAGSRSLGSKRYGTFSWDASTGSINGSGASTPSTIPTIVSSGDSGKY